MSIRQLRLPGDLLQIAEIAAETWHYPENPEWNVQPDEEESLADSMDNYQRIWPFIRLIQLFSPGLRDFLHGHVWEEEGRIAGFTQLHRRGITDTWYISAVGVHPDFRRRGIAQSLVKEAIVLVRQRNGKRLILDVIEDNVPAVNLYTKLGFENFSSNLMLDLENLQPPLEEGLPGNYLLETVDDFTWQPRYELVKRITPAKLTQFEPVEEGRYRKPLLTRLLFPILKRAEGLDVLRFMVKASDGHTIAYAMYDIRTRETGRNEIIAEIDPEYPDLPGYVINYMLGKVYDVNPGRVVEISIPGWQQGLFDAAIAAGFRLRFKLLTLGFLLDR